MHEDIIYHSQDWGKLVEKYFEQNQKAGLLGVAGTHYLSPLPSGWWETEKRAGHLIQGFISDGQYLTKEDKWSTPMSIATQVCAVDGLWLCMPKSLFDVVAWDETNLKGFHGYDMDMSLQVWNAGFEVHVFWDVLIEHKSLGNANMDFRRTNEVIWQKWQCTLPMVKGAELSDEDLQLRDMIVELQHIIRARDAEILRIYTSPTHRLGKLLLKPFSWLRRVFGKK